MGRRKESSASVILGVEGQKHSVAGVFMSMCVCVFMYEWACWCMYAH